MTVRIASFKGVRDVIIEEGLRTTRVTFDLPHRVMLTRLTEAELKDIKKQCERLLTSKASLKVIYLGSISSIEEISNELAT